MSKNGKNDLVLYYCRYCAYTALRQERPLFREKVRCEACLMNPREPLPYMYKIDEKFFVHYGKRALKQVTVHSAEEHARNKEHLESCIREEEKNTLIAVVSYRQEFKNIVRREKEKIAAINKLIKVKRD